jgi:hypothetical protein
MERLVFTHPMTRTTSLYGKVATEFAYVAVEKYDKRRREKRPDWGSMTPNLDSNGITYTGKLSEKTFP